MKYIVEKDMLLIYDSDGNMVYRRSQHGYEHGGMIWLYINITNIELG